jgi:hypothetical protein
MGWECGKFVGRAQVHIWYWCGTLKERDHFENQGVNENDSITKDVKEIFSGSLD